MVAANAEVAVMIAMKEPLDVLLQPRQTMDAPPDKSMFQNTCSDCKTGPLESSHCKQYASPLWKHLLLRKTDKYGNTLAHKPVAAAGWCWRSAWVRSE